MTPEPADPIILTPYDPLWPERFAAEANAIRTILGPAVTRIEHIGSTAVPGLAAKPIIDMLLAVTEPEPCIDQLTNHLGYTHLTDIMALEGRCAYLRKGIDGSQRLSLRLFQIHMASPDTDGEAFIPRHLAFRDYLRANPDTLAEYAELKARLAAEFGNDLAGYADAKNSFIRRIERLTLANQ